MPDRDKRLRTDDEMVARVQGLQSVHSPFEEPGDIISRIQDWDKVKGFYKAGITEKDCPPDPYTYAVIVEKINSYLDFAFGKCEDERGLSSIRSIKHFINWCWLIKDDEAYKFLSDDSNYDDYGLTLLEYVRDRFAPKSTMGKGTEQGNLHQPVVPVSTNPTDQVRS